MTPVDGCTGKERFATYTLAAKVAKRRRHSKGKGPQVVYRCLICRGFHLGGSRTFKPGLRRP